MRLAAIALVVSAVLTACAEGSGSLPGSDPSVAPLSPPPGDASGSTSPVTAGGCPIDEPRFCQEASAVSNALTQRNSDAVFALSRPTRLDCADLDPEVYPQCEDRDTLRGYTIADYHGAHFVVPARRYQRNLRFFVESIDEEYSDDLGGPEVRILGVSTCGAGETRSYHLVYTVGLGDPRSTFPGTRFLGTYEFTEQDREWAISTAHVGLLTDWQLVLDDALTDIGCGGIEAWGA